MALIPVDLKDQLKAAFDVSYNASKVKDADPEAIRDALCAALAAAIDTYIKSAEITIVTDQIQVQGTATAQANIIPIILTNSIT